MFTLRIASAPTLRTVVHAKRVILLNDVRGSRFTRSRDGDTHEIDAACGRRAALE